MPPTVCPLSELQHATGAGGVFGLVIALLAWLRLGAQATLLAAVLNVVLKRELYPGISAVAAGEHGHSEADLRYTARRHFTIDGARAVAIQLANATFAARQNHIWGQSTTTVASDSTHFRAYDQNLFTEWHSRYGGRGVLIYWHIECATRRPAVFPV